jgi:hypothetical protein
VGENLINPSSGHDIAAKKNGNVPGGHFIAPNSEIIGMLTFLYILACPGIITQSPPFFCQYFT